MLSVNPTVISVHSNAPGVVFAVSDLVSANVRHRTQRASSDTCAQIGTENLMRRMLALQRGDARHPPRKLKT